MNYAVTVFGEPSVVFSVQFALGPFECAVFQVQCKVHIVKGAERSVHREVYTMQY